MQTKTLQRLENLLCHWEQYCDVTHLNALLSQRTGNKYSFPIAIDGPLGYSRTLRQHILSSDTFDYDRYVFGSDPKFYPVWRETIGALTTFPITLFDWCKSSRRVYRLTEELTNLLRMTKVDDVQWRDLHFPFHTFIIEIENGFIDSNGCLHNFFMVNMCIDNGKKKMTITSIARKEGEFKIFPIQRFTEIRMLINRGQYEKAQKSLARVADESDCGCSSLVAPFSIDDEEKLTVGESIDRLEMNKQSENVSADFEGSVTAIAHQILRIVCGFALYLQTLPSGSTHISNWQPITGSTKCGKVIADGAQICEVSSSVKLTKEESGDLHEYFSKPCGHEMPAHFRHGHWRRPPGKGQDPTAIKTVWVRPCMVRFDRLPEGSLPIGNLQKVG